MLTRAFGDGGSLRGAALVTDERTRPLEFRVTEPVLPTELQRVLYGHVFAEHVVADLIGAPLLEALRETPDWVLVDDQSLLGLQELTGRPVIWIGRDDTVDDDDAGGEPGRPPGVVMGYHSSVEADGDGRTVIESARDALRRVAERYDLLEPFGRLETALAQVHAQGNAASA